MNNTKTCPRCKIDKEFPEEFTKGKSHCKVCHNEIGELWRKNNKEKYINSQKKECDRRKEKREGKERTVFDTTYFPSSATFYVKKHKLKNTLWILDYFETHHCIDCGCTDKQVLEFDHVRGVKEFNVSEMVQRGMSINKLEKEVQKCDVRCANCHTKRTAKQLKYMSYLVLEEDFLNSEQGKALQAPIKKIKVKGNKRIYPSK